MYVDEQMQNDTMISHLIQVKNWAFTNSKGHVDQTEDTNLPTLIINPKTPFCYTQGPPGKLL